MEWERAKNYILVFFVILNAGLAALLFLERGRYTMTGEHERNISAILAANNINIYTIPTRRFPPMRPLAVGGFYHDFDELIDIFFENPAEVRLVEDETRYIFDAGHSHMTIYSGFIFFDAARGYYETESLAGILSGWDGDVYNSEVTHGEAVALADEFINRHFPDFVLDMVFDEFGGVCVIYRQEYRGRLVHSNFIEFFVTADGIVRIDMHFGRILGHDGPPQMIFAPDKALLTFMQRVRPIAMENPIFITDMDLVYYQEFADGQPGHAVPVYRIFIRDRDFPFLINAYTNVIIIG